MGMSGTGMRRLGRRCQAVALHSITLSYIQRRFWALNSKSRRKFADLRERLLHACQLRAARRPERPRLGVHPRQQLARVFRLQAEH